MPEAQVYMVYSESGGVSKTTTAVSLAMTVASSGRKVVLIDLDPRGAATKWLGVEPAPDSGLHVGAILSAENADAGWAEELAVPTEWSPNLRVIPSDRSVSNREADGRGMFTELRLKKSLKDLDADVVIIDCPNRQGGPLILSAMYAAQKVIYAATPNIDGIDGFIGARTSIAKFNEGRLSMGENVPLLTEAGIVVSGIETIPSLVTKGSLDDFETTGMLIYPIVPARVIVKEARQSGVWFGNYRKGAPVAEAYAQIAEKVIA